MTKKRLVSKARERCMREKRERREKERKKREKRGERREKRERVANYYKVYNIFAINEVKKKKNEKYKMCSRLIVSYKYQLDIFYYCCDLVFEHFGHLNFEHVSRI